MRPSLPSQVVPRILVEQHHKRRALGRSFRFIQPPQSGGPCSYEADLILRVRDARAAKAEQIWIVTGRRKGHIGEMARRVCRDSWNAGLPGRFLEKGTGSTATGPNARFAAGGTALIPDVFWDVRKARRQTVLVVGGPPIRAVMPVLVEHGSANRHGIRSRRQHVDGGRVTRLRFGMWVIASSRTRIACGHHVGDTLGGCLLRKAGDSGGLGACEVGLAVSKTFTHDAR